MHYSEDGVNHESIDNAALYTQRKQALYMDLFGAMVYNSEVAEDILEIWKTLSPISPYFTIAAGFGNVHGVYKPGYVFSLPGKPN